MLRVFKELWNTVPLRFLDRVLLFYFKSWQLLLLRSVDDAPVLLTVWAKKKFKLHNVWRHRLDSSSWSVLLLKYLEYTVSKLVSVTETKLKPLSVQLWTLVNLITSKRDKLFQHSISYRFKFIYICTNARVEGMHSSNGNIPLILLKCCSNCSLYC